MRRFFRKSIWYLFGISVGLWYGFRKSQSEARPLH